MPTITERAREGDERDQEQEVPALGGEGAGTFTERQRRAAGEEERPVETAGTEATTAESGIDAERVADMTVDEVKTFVEANPSLRSTVVQLEEAGQGRKGVLALADTGDDATDDDTEGDGDTDGE